MPKPKPTEIIRHEVVLGKAERQLLRDAAEAYQFNKISTPIVAGLSDVTFTATVAGLLAFGLAGMLDRMGLDPDWREIVSDMTPDQVHDWLETQNLALGGIGALIGLFLGGPFGAAIGGVAGGVVAETGEYVIEEVEKIPIVVRFITWWQTLNLPAWAQSDGGLGSNMG